MSDFSKVAILLLLLPEVYECGRLLKSLPILGSVGVVNINPSSLCVLVSHCGFNSISLMVNDIEHLFMCLLPFLKYLFKSFAHVINCIFHFNLSSYWVISLLLCSWYKSFIRYVLQILYSNVWFEFSFYNSDYTFL